LAFTERDRAVMSEVTRFGVMSRHQLMRLKFFASKTRANDRLKRLVDEGLATRDVQQHAGKPDRHAYTITDRGRDELHRWLALPPEPHKERVELLLKLFHGWEMGPAVMIEHVKGARAEHEAFLQKYDHYDEAMAREDEPPTPYWLMTVSCGRHISKAYIEWCDETIAGLEKLPAEPRRGAEDWHPVAHDHPEEDE